MEGGGFVNVIVGSLLLCGFGMLVGMLIGIFVGVYFVEYGQKNLFVSMICFINDILLLVLLIVIGLFVYVIVVVKLGCFLGWVGVIVFVLLQILIVICMIENMFKFVLNVLCEVVVVFGMLKWCMVLKIMLCVLVGGIVMGVLFVVVWIVGEMVLLLFIVLLNQFFLVDMSQLMVNLLVMIYKFVMSLFVEWQLFVWVGVFLIMFGVFGLNVLVCLIFLKK